jgi:hypothetical protein
MGGRLRFFVRRKVPCSCPLSRRCWASNPHSSGVSASQQGQVRLSTQAAASSSSFSGNRRWRASSLRHSPSESRPEKRSGCRSVGWGRSPERSPPAISGARRRQGCCRAHHGSLPPCTSHRRLRTLRGSAKVRRRDMGHRAVASGHGSAFAPGCGEQHRKESRVPCWQTAADDHG